MSDVKPRVWLNAKILFAYVCVPVLVSVLIVIVLGSLQFAIEISPQAWGLESPGILLVMAWGALIAVPIAWLMGPLAFGTNFDPENTSVLWRQVAVGACAGSCGGGLFGLLLVGGAKSGSSGVVLVALGLIVLGNLLGVIHALALRYALLWLGLVKLTPEMKP